MDPWRKRVVVHRASAISAKRKIFRQLRQPKVHIQLLPPGWIPSTAVVEEQATRTPGLSLAELLVLTEWR